MRALAPLLRCGAAPMLALLLSAPAPAQEAGRTPARARVRHASSEAPPLAAAAPLPAPWRALKERPERLEADRLQPDPEVRPLEIQPAPPPPRLGPGLPFLAYGQLDNAAITLDLEGVDLFHQPARSGAPGWDGYTGIQVDISRQVAVGLAFSVVERLDPYRNDLSLAGGAIAFLSVRF